MEVKNPLIARYLQNLEHNQGRAVGTVINYRGHIERLDKFLQSKGSSLETATRELLTEFSGIQAHKDKLSVSTRRPLVAAVKSFYNWMYDHDLMSANPAEKLKHPKQATPLPQLLSKQNAEKLLACIDLNKFSGVRDAAIIALFISTGMRLSGIHSMNESSLQQVEIDGQERLFVKVSEKGKKERVIPVPDAAAMYLIAYLSHPELAKINRVLPDGDSVFFVNTVNFGIPQHEYYGEARRLSKRNIRGLFKKYGARVGIPAAQLHPHAARHLYGTELAEDGVDLERIRMLLGHSNLETTKVYLHLASRKLFDLVNKSSPIAKINTAAGDIAAAIKKANRVRRRQG